MQLSEVVGNEKIKNVLLRQAERNHVSHAYIFEGKSGTGKKTTALAFAKILVCETPQSGAACGKCKACLMAEENAHPDIRLITNQLYDNSKKSTDVLVDTVRNMKQEIYIKPYMAARKIYIIPNADTMNVYAQNSILKILEEPPEYCTIILIAENANLFLPTILSRAVLLRFLPIPAEEISLFLQKNFPHLSKTEAEQKAIMSGGSLKRAIELLNNSDADKLRNETVNRVLALTGGKKRSIYDAVLFLKGNKEDIDFITDIMRDVFCDLLQIKSGGLLSVINKDKQYELESAAQKISPAAPLETLEILLKYKDLLSRNINYAIAVLGMAVELWEALND